MKVVNDKARFQYEVGEKLEVGVVLSGPEVKSAKLGQVDMSSAYVKARPGVHGGWELWVVGLKIFPYKHADNSKYDPSRARKLLLHQKEILSLMSHSKQAARMIVPLSMYTNSGRLKMEIGLARGKKIYEKREDKKKRDLERDEERRLG